MSPGVTLATNGMHAGPLAVQGFSGQLGPPPPPVGGDGSNVYSTVPLNNLGAGSKVVNTSILNV